MASRRDHLGNPADLQSACGSFALEMRDITKVYPNGTVANAHVHFACQKGEIHALLGENGAGKTTLMNILYGLEQPSSGEIWIEGKKAQTLSPAKALELGIGMVHQHFLLDPALTVTENVVLGREPGSGFFLDRTRARSAVQEIVGRIGFSVDVDTLVDDLEIGQKQRVEIIKALYADARILILDEPTAILSASESASFFEQLHALRKAGYTIILITHKLHEVKQICDRATILKNGKSVATVSVPRTSISEMKTLMGLEGVNGGVELDTADLDQEEEVALRQTSKANPAGNSSIGSSPTASIPVADNSATNGTVVLSSPFFSVRAGEIVGIRCFEGGHDASWLDQIIGLAPSRLAFQIDNQPIPTGVDAVHTLRKRGVRYIPADRLHEGVAQEESVLDNLIANDAVRTGAVLAQELVNRFEIKIDSLQQRVRHLSGGNIQKLVAAREMGGAVKLLLLDQPTRGLDAQAAMRIHTEIRRLAREGTAVLLRTTDAFELNLLADRIIQEGEFTPEGIVETEVVEAEIDKGDAHE